MNADQQYPYVVLWKSLSYKHGRWTVEGKHDYAEDAVSHATQLAEKRSDQRGELRIVCFRPNAGNPAVSMSIEDGEVFYAKYTDAANQYENHVLHSLGTTNLD